VALSLRGSTDYVIAWQRADDLAQSVYRLTWKFTQSDPALAQRICAAALMVAAGIVGACRQPGTVRARRGLRAAEAALGELGYYLHFARRIGLIAETDLKRANVLVAEVVRHLDPLLDGGTPATASTGS
jgi:four helix bundle protein